MSITAAMTPIELLDRDGDPLETVYLPPFAAGSRPEIVAWGSRSFVRDVDGRYREAFAWQAFTAREIQAMGLG